MARNSKKGRAYRQQSYNLAQGSNTKSKAPNYSGMIAPKAISQARQDIKTWKEAERLTKLEENPKWWKQILLYKDIRKDALLTSQYKNRTLKALGETIILKKPNGDIDQEQSDFLNNAVWSNEINKHILDSIYEGHSLLEFSFNDAGILQVDLIPRENVNPRDGLFYPDYMEDKSIDYREVREYGTWLLEFGEKDDLGLLNNAVPHVLFKRFAQSCWSELCEINGIPPRVLKTNTQDPTMMRRGEKMMRDMGAAAWFIIDESEKFEFAQSATQSGDVYSKLITLCDNQNSLLFSGAIIGQDTKNGSRSKDESSREVLQTLIDGDLVLLEKYWNSRVIPALQALGVIKGDVTYGYEQTEDLEQLWKMTSEVMQYKNVDDKWIIDKFGIQVTGDRVQPSAQNLNLSSDFFV